MHKYYLFLAVFGMLFWTSPTFAQNKIVTGRVTDENGESIIGANVIAVSEKLSGTTTDINGNYTLQIPEGVTKIQISFVGYVKAEELVGNRTVIDVQLVSDLTTLKDIVVIGYGVVEKKDLIGSVVSIKSEDLENRSPTSALEAIQGRLAGVQITTNSGSPGAGASIQIRGLSTFEGGVTPLYVVDGQPQQDIDNINPADIASIDVLKDGASAAIYGSRSANGVVIVTTKRGISGKPKLSVNYLKSFGNLIGKVPVPNTSQRLAYEFLSAGNNVLPNGDSLNPIYQNDTDWQEVISRIAVRDRLNFSFSGGNEISKYYINAGYLNHKGLIVNSDFNRLSTKLNFDYIPNDKFKTGISTNLSSEKLNGVNERTFLQIAVAISPFQPVYDYDGSEFNPNGGGLFRRNPLTASQTEKRITRTYRANLFQYIEYKFIPSLTYKATGAANLTFRKQDIFTPSFISSDGTAFGSQDIDIFSGFLHEQFITWNPNLGKKHNLNSVFGASIQKDISERTDLRSELGFSSDEIQTLNAATAFNARTTSAIKEDNTLASIFGRVSYDYRKKYFFSATLRRDGSSRFGPANRFGNFPAMAIGWSFTEEAFMNRIKNILSFGKLRASFAITGNERIGNYDARTLNFPGFFYDGNNGIRLTQIGDSRLSWESTEQSNIGLDLNFLDDRISVTVDAYRKETEDLLFRVPLPIESPVETARSNFGAISNEGIELNVSGTVVRSNDFAWKISFNISKNRNKVVSLPGGTPFDVGGRGNDNGDGAIWRIEEGQPIGNFYGFTNLGIFSHDESNAFTKGGEQLTPIFNEGVFSRYELNGQPYASEVVQKTRSGNPLRGGDINWKDVNNDGVIDVDDRQILGNGQAGFFGGLIQDFKYKNFNFNLSFDYSLNRQLYRFFEWNRNKAQFFTVTASPDAIDRSWKQPGDLTDYPILDRNRSVNRLGANSFYVDNGSFIKLRTIRIDYRIPENIGSRLKLTNANISFAVNNVLTWTNYKGYDPEQVSSSNPLEIGRDELQYPRQREFIVKLNLEF